MLDHFFDDFFLVSVPAEANTNAFCLRETFSSLGLTLDAEKSQLLSEAAQILGVVFCTSKLETERLLSLEPKPTRRNNLLIRRIMAEGQLNPTVAASLVGKFGFLCSTLFGKIGRACTGPIRARQYSSSLDFSLNPQITLSLRLMEYLALHCKPRSKMLNYTRHPLILYTDASDVEARGEDRWVLGAVLVDPNTDTITHTSWVFPTMWYRIGLQEVIIWAKLGSLPVPWLFLLGDPSFLRLNSSISWTTSQLPAILLKALAPLLIPLCLSAVIG